MNATLMNGANCTLGEGVVFDGAGGYVDLEDVPLGGPMTIAFWARWDALNYFSRLCDFADGDEYADNIIIANMLTVPRIDFDIVVGSSVPRSEKFLPAGSIVLGA